MARLIEIEVSIDRRERQARCDVALARLQDRRVLLEQLERQDLAGKPAGSVLRGLFVPRSEQFARRYRWRTKCDESASFRRDKRSRSLKIALSNDSYDMHAIACEKSLRYDQKRP